MRATMRGADLPFRDPSRDHGTALEGQFWRFVRADGVAVVALLAVCRDAAGRRWGMAALAAHPGGEVAWRVADRAAGHARGPGVRMTDGGAVVVEATRERVRFDLGPGARLDVRLEQPAPWPRRALGAMGPAQIVPGLSQYWHPWLLRARARGEAQFGGGARIGLDGATAYAERNWGAGGMPPGWWWGQAHAGGATVAFAGGRAGLGPLRTTGASLVVALPGGEALRFVRPLVPVSVEAGDGRWRLRARTARHRVEVEGTAAGDPHLLPVPVPRERRVLEGRSPQHLAATLHVRVRRRGRTVLEATSDLAGLELGRG